MDSKPKIEWTKATTLRLIELWQQYPFLYDTKNKLHNNRHARSDALTKIAHELQNLVPDMTENDVKTKMTNLRTQYNHELKKEKFRNETDNDMYICSAYWYEDMKFLKNFMTTREGLNYSDLERKPRIVDISHVMDTSNDIDNNDDDPLFSLDDSHSSTDVVTRKIKQKIYNENDILIDTNDTTIQRVTPSIQNSAHIRYDHDIETFGEFIKSELQSVQNDEVRDDIKYKIYNIIYEEKKSLRKVKKTKT